MSVTLIVFGVFLLGALFGYFWSIRDVDYLRGLVSDYRRKYVLAIAKIRELEEIQEGEV